MFIGRTDAEAEAPILWPPWYKELTHLKRLWCWERWRGGGEGGNRGWDGWMASLTQWTWVWASSRSWWWTGKPGMLQSMGLQSQTQLSGWKTNGRDWRCLRNYPMLELILLSLHTLPHGEIITAEESRFYGHIVCYFRAIAFCSACELIDVFEKLSFYPLIMLLICST